MLGLLALTFLAGCIVGAVIIDLARWQHQRGAAQNLLRGLDSGTLYYGQSGHTEPGAHESNTPT